MKKVFNLYKSGILVSSIVVEGNRISCKNKNIYDGTWGRESADKPDAPGGIMMDVKKYISRIDIFEKAICLMEDSMVIDGCRYEKHMDAKYEGIVFWVQRDVKWPVDLIESRGTIIGFIQQNRENTVMVVKEGFESITPVNAWMDKDISQPDCDIQFLGDTFVKMHDGARLATSVWLPQCTKSRKHPVILIRTPYGKNMLAVEELRYVRRGYALVAQDVRGREESEGKWVPFLNEAEDGDATLQWIGSQDWCDGNIGMIGASYGGFVQWAAASKGNPYLKAQVSIVTAGSPFNDVPRKGGTYMSGMLAWCFAMSGRVVDKSAMERDDWESIIITSPISSIFKQAYGRDSYFWNKWIENSDYNSFWENSDWTLHNKNINVPSLVISGWYDDNITGSLEAWRVMNKPGKGKSRLLMGPWCHDVNTSRDVHHVSFGKNSLYYNIDLLHLMWFDRFLKGYENGVDETRVTYYSTGNNTWNNEADWPPQNSKMKKLYFNSGRELSWKEGNTEGFEEYVYDPLDPAPHVIDISENEMNIPGNYRDVEKRHDVIVFSTVVLLENVAVAGSATVVFYASASAKDTDWIVRLLDVDAHGNSIKVAQGILRARYRNGFDKPQLLQPDKVERYEINLDDLANVFESGHRIRVSITSSAHGYILENHNTGNDPGYDEEFVKSTQRIYFGKNYSSHLIMSVV